MAAYSSSVGDLTTANGTLAESVGSTANAFTGSSGLSASLSAATNELSGFRIVSAAAGDALSSSDGFSASVSAATNEFSKTSGLTSSVGGTVSALLGSNGLNASLGATTTASDDLSKGTEYAHSGSAKRKRALSNVSSNGPTSSVFGPGSSVVTTSGPPIPTLRSRSQHHLQADLPPGGGTWIWQRASWVSGSSISSAFRLGGGSTGNYGTNPGQGVGPGTDDHFGVGPIAPTTPIPS